MHQMAYHFNLLHFWEQIQAEHVQSFSRISYLTEAKGTRATPSPRPRPLL